MRRLISIAAQYSPSLAVYIVVGGISALVEWGVFYSVLKLAGTHYVVASAWGFLVATFANYLLSSKVAFNSRGRSVRSEIFLVYVVSAIGLVINMLVMIGLVELAHIHVVVAKVAGTGCAFAWNFLARQLYIFARGPRWSVERIVELGPALRSRATKTIDR